ncbi:hypothetical protein D3C84_523880 [compost metagenome]|uniref:hypothetical protein n=1 Tax=Pseudomonas sp. R5(2019) TaxID=2697566 RepID=UPI000F995707|nr:hypothetical protein [Pseudomonas sp. R5(2019)]NBA95313.1 hypothetical protein [Pseudomonas sp. R5(2019)]
MKVLNFSCHRPTPDQIEAGVIEMGVREQKRFRTLTSYYGTSKPDDADTETRVKALVELAKNECFAFGVNTILLHTALWIAVPLVEYLDSIGINTVYPFCTREIAPQNLPSGEVRFTRVHKHSCFANTVFVAQ